MTSTTVPAGSNYESVVGSFRWQIPRDFNLGVACADAQRGRDTAVVEFDLGGEHRSHTFAALAETSGRVANALLGLGLEHGDRVALLLPQGFAAAAAHLGIYKSQLVAVPLSHLFGPDALEHRLLDSGARAIVVSAHLLDNVADIANAAGMTVIVEGVDQVSSPHLSFAELLRDADATFAVPATPADTPAFIIYTSGTTGSPKGALHAHRALIGHLPGFELSHSYFPKEQDLFWTPADWAWIGGLMDALMPTLYFGRPIVAVPPVRFDPELAIKVIVQTRARNVFIPPTALRLMKSGGVRLPPGTLRTAMSGGESLGADTLEWARDHLGVTVAEIYGQTEANYLVGNTPGLLAVRPGSMGRPYPGHEVVVIDELGVPVPPGTVGEIAVHTPDPVAFLGYWHADEATALKFIGPWLRTGDLASADSDGYLWFKGRADDLIMSAGYRISPVEVEQCLQQHPAVSAVAVVGVPDELRGQIVKAFVIPRSGSGDSVTATALQDFVRKQLAAYEYPREIEFVSELPLTVTGKIRRHALTERSAQPKSTTG